MTTNTILATQMHRILLYHDTNSRCISIHVAILVVGEISAAYVAFYHLLILALPFGFWGWWQATHPGDLQNASVPVTVVLTMLSLFWGTNGILTQGRKLGEIDV